MNSCLNNKETEGRFTGSFNRQRLTNCTKAAEKDEEFQSSGVRLIEREKEQ